MKDAPVLTRALADRLSDGIIVVGESGLAYANGRGLMLLGAARAEDVVGRSLSSLLSAGTCAYVVRQAENHRPDAPVETMSGHLVRLDGGTVPVRLSSLPILWEGTPSRLLVIAHGAGSSEAADRARAEANRYESSKMETIGMLVAGIAHEFNNNLTAVLGFSQLAIMLLPADGKAHRHIQHVITAGRKASELIHQALMFSRQHAESRRPLSLHALVNDSLKFLRSTIPSWIELRERIAATTSPIEADAVQVRQVLVNLIVDAVHAMRRAGGVLDIEVQDEELSADRIVSGGRIGAGRYVCVRVSDSGESTEQDTITRVFDPSLKADVFGGERGVGLAVVHGIVSAHGGTVLVESKPGPGTTIVIVFPALTGHRYPQTVGSLAHAMTCPLH